MTPGPSFRGTDRPDDSEEDQNPPGYDAAAEIVEVPDALRANLFRFQFGPALLQQLHDRLDSVGAVPFPPGALVADYPGFYQLFYDDKPVYIGKTSRTVAARLEEHRATLLRLGIELSRIKLRFVFVEDRSLVDISEQSLIRFFDAKGEAAWNGTGFGSKVSGFGRGAQKMSRFRELFPPNFQRAIEAGSATPLKLEELIRQLDQRGPIYFKIPRLYLKRFRKDFGSAHTIPPATLPYTEWAERVAQLISPGWTVQRQPMTWYVVPSDAEDTLAPDAE